MESEKIARETFFLANLNGRSPKRSIMTSPTSAATLAKTDFTDNYLINIESSKQSERASLKLKRP